MQTYSDPSREGDAHALPDVEVFRANYADCLECGSLVQSCDCVQGACPDCGRIIRLVNHGFFWWPCFPGCLPDGDPTGPFPTAEAAKADAQAASTDS